MPRPGRPSPLLCYLLALTQVFWLVGCQDSIKGSGSGASSTLAGVLATQDLGRVAFDAFRAEVVSEPPGAARDARLAALDARRSSFIKAVNDIVNVRTVQGVAQTADALYALVDDGTLPLLAEHLATTLEDLRGDPRALDALLSLARGPGHTGIPTDALIGLLGRMVNYPETEQLWQAIVALIDENDGVDAQGNPNGEPDLLGDVLAFARDLLDRAGQAGGGSSALGDVLRELARCLADEATVRGTFDFGAPEWVVRLDDRGLPQVATDPTTGRLYAPFVDADGDGLADTDAQGALVDAAGDPIDLPTFGAPGTVGYGPDGRAVAGSGEPLYVYVDAKRTILALFMQLGGELVARGVHARGRELLEAGLGAPGPDGTYGADNPVLDLGWGALALLEPDVAPRMLRAGARLIEQDPDLAEGLLVAVSRALEANRNAARSSSFGSTRISDPRVLQLVDDLLPLADDLFAQPTRGGVSTARQVMDTLADLRTTAPDFAPQLAPLLLFVRVERELVPDGDRNTIDEARSDPVDRAQPAWIGAADNRSAVHQLLDLLARANGCSFFGQNLAVMVIDAMAGLTPATVGTLVAILNATPGFLTNLVCAGVSQDLHALDALAKSGALDAFLPLAKAFRDRGETELLVRLLVRLQRDYEALLRPLEEDVALYLDGGAFEACVEVIDLARRVHDPVTQESVTDTLARALEQLVDDDVVVLDPRGARVPSRAYLLLNPLVALDQRVVAAGLTGEVDRLSEDLFAVFLERAQVNGQERLRNGSLLPLAARLLDDLAQALPADAVARRQEVEAAQRGLRDVGSSKDAATLLALLRTIDRSPSRDLIDRAVANLLTPHRPDDIFGGVARLGVTLLEKPPSGAALGDLAPFVARVLDPQRPLLPSAVRAFQRLLSADQGQTTLNLLRAAFNPGPGERHAPAEVLLATFQEVTEAGAPHGVTYDRVALEAHLARATAFIRDDRRGLTWIFELIRTRQVR